MDGESGDARPSRSARDRAPRRLARGQLPEHGGVRSRRCGARARRRSRVFTGGVLGACAVPRNSAYDLASPENVDGLLIMSGTLANTVGPEALARFCERYRPLPLCSIAVALPGVPSVLVDNAARMRELVLHLVEDHGYRRLAFIRGPEANAEAERRFGVFRDVLAEHDLTIDPELVVVGDFQRAAGAAAVGRLLDERPRAFDVIVAASDPMALGALDALKAPRPPRAGGRGGRRLRRRRGGALRHACAHHRAAAAHEQGQRAVETLLSMLAGKDVPAQITLRTELCTRRSCAALAHGAARGMAFEPMPAGASFQIAFAARRAHRHRRGGERAPRDGARARDGGGRGPRRRVQRGARRRGRVADRDLRRDAGALVRARASIRARGRRRSALRRDVIRSIDASNTELRVRAEDLIHDLRAVAADTAERGARAAAARGRAVRARSRQHQRGARRQLRRGGAGARRRRAPTAARHRELLSVFYDRAEPHRDGARLVLAYDAAREADAAPSGLVFPARQLAPRGALPERRATFVPRAALLRRRSARLRAARDGPARGTVYEALRPGSAPRSRAPSSCARWWRRIASGSSLLDALEKRARSWRS